MRAKPAAMLLLGVTLGIWSFATGACTVYSEDLLLDADGEDGTSGSAGAGRVGTGSAGAGGDGTGGDGTGGEGTGGEGTGGDGTGGDPGITGPCDIHDAAQTPCVGAWSTVRALYGEYSGPLYQVRRTSDGATQDIPVLSAGGYVDSSVQDSFCPGDCTISVLYDQSSRRNDLPVSGPAAALPDGGTESNAKAAPISIGGHPVYGLLSEPGVGNAYRNNSPTGTATGDEAEAISEVVASTVYNDLCCNPFGNVQTTGEAGDPGALEAIYFGNCTFFGSGGGNAPWILADLEAGTFPSNLSDDPSNTSIAAPNFATLMLRGFSGNRFALKAGDAQSGSLITKWDGARPDGYTPMQKQGGLGLEAGGEGSHESTGLFFEGAVTIGCPDDDSVDDAIQANIVAAGYGQ